MTFASDEKSVYVRNSAETNGEAMIPWATFLGAWHMWFIPNGEFQFSEIATGKHP